MSRTRRTAAAALAAALALPAAAAHADDTGRGDGYGRLRTRLATILSDPSANGSGDHVSLVVRRVDTGDVVYGHDGGRLQIPASNTKILTSAASMHVLGPGYRWRTSVRAQGEIVGGVLRGDLYLVGRGDPSTIGPAFRDLAQQVRDAGITRVTGHIYVDDTYFDARRYGRGWSPSYFSEYYAGQISGLTVAPTVDFDAGTVIVRTRPTTVGERPSVSLIPQAGRVLDLDNNATTVSSGGSNYVWAQRELGTNHVTIDGSVAAGGPGEYTYVTVHDPAVVAGKVFRNRLRKVGVRVTSGISHRKFPSGSSRVSTRLSWTLARMLNPWMKLSNNMISEHAVKTMGAETTGDQGTWSNGLPRVRRYAYAHGVARDQLSLADGSGLTRDNHVTARALSNFLVHQRAEPWFTTWYDAFPIAGMPDRMVGGSLRERMLGTPAVGNVHAKTGTLTGVTALSGYATDKDGHLLAFSMISNYSGTSPRPLEDKVGAALAAYDPTP